MESKLIGVLDHGFIQLTNSMGSDYSIYRNAKVSTGAPKDDIDDQHRLINFLVKEGHTSPLEFVELEFHMQCPIYVARQHFRHRMQEANEYSLRYRSAIDLYESVDDLADLTPEEMQEFKKLSEDAYKFYERVINRTKEAFPGKENMFRRSRIREKVRGVLGTAYYTQFYWKMNLHAFANWVSKRIAPGAQPEIQVYAKAALELARPVAPIAFDAIEKHWIRKEED